MPPETSTVTGSLNLTVTRTEPPDPEPPLAATDRVPNPSCLPLPDCVDINTPDTTGPDTATGLPAAPTSTTRAPSAFPCVSETAAAFPGPTEMTSFPGCGAGTIAL